LETQSHIMWLLICGVIYWWVGHFAIFCIFSSQL